MADAHQAVHAGLALQIAIGLRAADDQRRVIDAGLLVVLSIEQFDRVIVLLRPADVHPQQHLGPIVGVGAAGPGMDFEIAIVAVGLAREQAFEFAAGRVGAQSFKHGLGLGDDRGLAFGLAQLDQLDRLVDLARDAPVIADRLIEPGALAQQLLRRGGIVPQARVLGLGV